MVYKVVQANLLNSSTLTDLEVSVNQNIKDGFLPIGGPFIINSFVCQAMTKVEDSQNWDSILGSHALESTGDHGD